MVTAGPTTNVAKSNPVSEHKKRMNMNKQTFITALLVLVAMAFASCGSDEPQWADPEAHEKTEQ